MGKTGVKHLSKKDFDLIQTLNTAGVTQTKIREITGRATNTISRVTNSKTFAEYRKQTTQNNKFYHNRADAKQAGQVPPSKEEISPNAVVVDMNDIAGLRSDMKILTNRVNFIVTHMVIDPDRKAPEQKEAGKKHSRLAIFS